MESQMEKRDCFLNKEGPQPGGWEDVELVSRMPWSAVPKFSRKVLGLIVVAWGQNEAGIWLFGKWMKEEILSGSKILCVCLWVGVCVCLVCTLLSIQYLYFFLLRIVHLPDSNSMFIKCCKREGRGEVGVSEAGRRGWRQADPGDCTSSPITNRTSQNIANCKTK